MGDPVTMGLAAGAMGMYLGSKQKPEMPAPPALTPPPQPAQAPNVQAVSAATKAGEQGGYSQTFLSGPMGVDPNALKLGKPTLLGS